MTAPANHDHLFVDEAGDLTLFDKAGRNIVGTPGVSNYFMLGVVQLPDPERVGRELAQLRADLLRDPWFTGVPSMDPNQRKTAVFFHAKDDVPEVRREVFRLLRTFGVTARIAIRRKQALAAEAADFFQRDRKLRPDDVYDDLVRRLFE